MKKLFLSLILSVSLLVSSVYADTKYVSPDGTGDGNSVGSPDCFSDAFLALRSINGDHTISFAAGTYTFTADGETWESWTAGDGLTLEAGSGLTTDDVIIDGNNQYKFIYFNHAAAFSVSKLTFQNFAKSVGSGAAIRTDICTNLTITDCVFQDNICTTASGTCRGAGIYTSNNMTGELTITRCVFNNNQVSSIAMGGGTGGAVYADNNTDVTIVDCVFRGNIATYGCGAVAIYHNGATDVVISGSTFESNRATTHSGALGITSANATVAISGNTWKNNSASTHQGGAIKLFGTDTAATFDGDTFISNASNGAADVAAGGAIKFSDGATGNVKNCFFQLNSSSQGGAIDFGGISSLITSTVEYCIFDRNTAIHLDGGAWQAINGNNVTAKNNIYYGNTSALTGDSVNGYNGTITLRNEIYLSNLVFDSTNTNELIHSEADGTLDIQYCNIEGGADAVTAEDTYTNNINSDSLFRSVSRGKFTLKDGSPCLNAGTDVSLTRDHNDWLIVGTPSIGAYQYEQSMYQEAISDNHESVNTKTATGILSYTDSGIIYVNCASGAVSLYLPPLTNGLGLAFTFFKTDATANTLTILSSDDSGTINGDANKTLDGQYGVLSVFGGASEWSSY